MASNFETQAKAEVDAGVFVDHEETVKLTAVGAAEADASVIVLRETRVQVFNHGNTVEAYDLMDILVRTSVLATPKVYVQTLTGGDSWTIDGATWYSREIVENNAGGYHRLRLTNKLFPYGNWGNG